jgi:hypothetical protein
MHESGEAMDRRVAGLSSPGVARGTPESALTVRRALAFGGSAGLRSGGSGEGVDGGGESIVDKAQRLVVEKERKLAQKRLEKEAAERAQLQAAPRINERSRQLAARRREGEGAEEVAARGARMLAAKEQKLAALRAAQEEKERAQLQAAPQINARSRQLERHGTMEEWEEKRRAKLERAREDKERREAAEASGKPQLSRGTEKWLRARKERLEEELASSRADDDGPEDAAAPAAGVHGGGGSEDAAGSSSTRAPPAVVAAIAMPGPGLAGERLYRLAKVYEDRAEKRREQEERESRSKAKPTLSEHSAAYKPREPAVDRLYLDAERKRERAALRVAERDRAATVDEKDGRPLFEPRSAHAPKHTASVPPSAIPRPPPLPRGPAVSGIFSPTAADEAWLRAASRDFVADFRDRKLGLFDNS